MTCRAVQCRQSKRIYCIDTFTSTRTAGVRLFAGADSFYNRLSSYHLKPVQQFQFSRINADRIICGQYFNFCMRLLSFRWIGIHFNFELAPIISFYRLRHGFISVRSQQNFSLQFCNKAIAECRNNIYHALQCL